MSFERLRGVGPAGDKAPAGAEGSGGLSLMQRAEAHRLQIRRKANDDGKKDEPEAKGSDDDAESKKGDEADSNEAGDEEAAEVSQEGDPEEQEADRVADQVADDMHAGGD